MKPRVCAYSRTSTSLVEWEEDWLARSELLVGAFQLSHITNLRLRAHDHPINFLQELQPQYVYKWDGQTWWMDQVSWNIIRAFQKACHENDWYLKDITGQIMSVDDKTCYVNWTKHCPVGRIGDATGLKSYEWYARKLGELTENWAWGSGHGFNGVMFEILVDCLGSFGNLNVLKNACPQFPNRIIQGVSKLCGLGGNEEPLSTLMREANIVFYENLRTFAPHLHWCMNDMNSMTGPWWRFYAHGRKLENWMRGKPNPSWDEWMWDGDPHYMDALQGYNNIVYVHYDASKSYDWNIQRQRFGIGTALLGKGYVCLSQDELHPMWHYWLDTELGRVTNTYPEKITFGDKSIYCRYYEHAKVTVNPELVEVAGIPAQDALLERRP